MALYNGDDTDTFKGHLEILSEGFENLIPIILLKNANQAYVSVNVDFPKCQAQGGIDILQASTSLVEAVEYIKGKEKQIDRTKANRAEKFALEAYDLILPFYEILRQRIVVADQHDRAKDWFQELKLLEPGVEVYNIPLNLMIENDEQQKQALRGQLSQASKRFSEAKAKFITSIGRFQTESRALARHEKLIYGYDGFNPNPFLNFERFYRQEFDGLTMPTYIGQQAEVWKKLIKAVLPVPQEEQRQQPHLVHQDIAPEQGLRETHKYQTKYQSLEELLAEVDACLLTLRIEEMRTYKNEVLKLRTNLLDLKSEPGVLVEKDDAIKEAMSCVRRIDTRIEELQEEKKIEDEERKQNAAANIRALGTVKLANLTGFADYLGWRKSQKALNSHTDPHKKASLLLSTLKNQKDIERCEGIFDYEELMKILEQKYAHQDKLVPALLNKLRRLQEPNESEDIMMDNIGTILNVHHQLKSLSESALSYFDSTVVEDLVLKLTRRKQEDYEDYVDLGSSDSSDLSESEPEVNSVVVPGESVLKKSKSSGDAGLDSKKKRIQFINFLKKVERKIANLQARRTNLAPVSASRFQKAVKKKENVKRGKPKTVSAKAVKVVKDKTPEEYKCPVCQSTTPHLNRKGNPTKQLNACKLFRQMPISDREAVVKSDNRCVMCLGVGHTQSECSWKGGCLKKNCTERHNSWLCPKPMPDTDDDEVEAKSASVNDDKNLLVVTGGTINGKDSKKNSSLFFFDSGSTHNFIKDEVARKLGYKGKIIDQRLETLGDKKRLKLKQYTIQIVDRKNQVYSIPCFGIPYIGKRCRVPHKKIVEISKVFKVNTSDLNKSCGEIDLLIGMSHYSLFPTTVDRKGNLGLLKSEFGQPFLIVGSPKGAKGGPVKCNFVSVEKRNFWDFDDLGLSEDPKCQSCMKAPKCKSCSALTNPTSYKEQEEGKMLRNSMEFDYDNKEIRVSYPPLKDLEQVFHPSESNKKLATKMANNLRKSLVKDKILTEYTDNFLDMESRGVVRELSLQEMKDWEGSEKPVNYCSHHAVIKDFKSTKVRVVCNSSLSHNGTSLNCLLPKGPKALSNLLHVIMRFRSKPFALVADLTKAYWTIKTSEADLHLRRFLWWRHEDFDDPDAPLRTFGMCRMTFGDRPAQYYLELSKEEISNYARDVLKEEQLAAKIISSSYVDDVCPAFETMVEAEAMKALLPKAFQALGFKFKEIEVIGPQCKSESEPQDMFGHVYNLQEDRIELKFEVNLSKKKRGQKSKEKRLDQSSDLSKVILTKRQVQAVLGSQYDPLGLASPFLAKYKLYLSHIHKGYDWDTPFGPEDQAEGIGLIRELIQASQSTLSFPRSNKSCEDLKLKTIVAFSDGSSVAFTTVLYGVYHKDGKVHSTSLLTSKMKIAHRTVPRNELDGLVASHRLVKNYLQAVDDESELEEIVFLTDSTCTLDFIKSNYVSKEVYIRNRVAEIQRTSRELAVSCSYGWIPSEMNISDKGTRNTCTFEFLSTPEWQYGPPLIRDLKSHVKFVEVFNSLNKSGSIVCNKASVKTRKQSAEEDPWQSLLQRTNNLTKALRVFSLVKGIVKQKRFKLPEISSAEMSEAFLFFVQKAQAEIPVDKRTKQLLTFEENGVIYTKMRFTPESHTLVFKKDKLPVVSAKSRLGRLLLFHAHANGNFKTYGAIHNTLHQTLVNTRVGLYGVYMTYAKQAIKGLVRSCVVCRRSQKKEEQAVMDSKKGGFGTIPEDGSAFNKIAIDYFGPFFAKLPKKTVQTRAVRNYKIFGLAMLCLQTRAVKIYPVEGYDTISFLTVFKLHCANHGVPSTILSDPMKAFVKAANTLDDEKAHSQDLQADLDQDSEIESLIGRTFGVKWTIIPPGSQWRDPAERTIKSIKEMMKSVFNTDKDPPVLTLGEYYSLFSEISEILNRRPIQGKLDEDDVTFISPNDLLLGRTSKDQTSSEIKIKDPKSRLSQIQEIKSQFWDKYMEVLASDSKLQKYPCWYKANREPRVNDVVLLVYKTRVSSGYRIGRILEVKDGRNLKLLVSPHQKGGGGIKKPSILEVPVQRTILLYSPFEEMSGEESSDLRSEGQITN